MRMLINPRNGFTPAAAMTGLAYHEQVGTYDTHPWLLTSLIFMARMRSHHYALQHRR